MATEIAVTAASGRPRATKTGWKSAEIAGSPNQPSAKEASVIPNWQAERYAFTLSAICAARFAPGFPSSTRSSTCDLRTRTKENSAITKKAFINKKKTTNKRLTQIGMY